MSLEYASDAEGAAVWLSDDEMLTPHKEQFLPNTHGQGCLVTWLVEAQGEATLSLMVRHWGLGMVWFDSVLLRSVGLTGSGSSAG